METLLVAKRDLVIARVLDRLGDGRITTALAARELGKSSRQIRRLRRRYEQALDPGLLVSASKTTDLPARFAELACRQGGRDASIAKAVENAGDDEVSLGHEQGLHKGSPRRRTGADILAWDGGRTSWLWADTVGNHR